MKSGIISFLAISFFLMGAPVVLFSQNIGIGTTTPAARFHIKGSMDTSQFVIDANIIQSNLHPLIRLRNSDGADLMWIHSDDASNVFLGLQCGMANQVNLANYRGISNTFTGSQAGKSNTSGSSNTAHGYAALGSNTSGSDNTANGAFALFSNIGGYDNTANGSGALYSNNYGYYNTAVGRLALFKNTSGNSNTAIGMNALQANVNGNFNTATGKDALYSNTSGSHNTANGYGALIYNTTGGYNTGTGYVTLYYNSTGDGNTAFGDESLVFNYTGSYNTAVGLGALYSTTASNNNTMLGSRAGDSYNMGWNNTLIGANSDVNAAGLYNTVVVGESGMATANNQVRIGNSSTSSIGGFTGWTNISDGRVKQNIKDNVPGLLFISKLKPVTYNLNLNAIEMIIGKNERKDNNGKIVPDAAFETAARRQKEQIVYSGFVAQDVEIAARQSGFDFSGVDAPKNEHDLYGLRYAEFVVPLVKAVQEVSDRNAKLELLAIKRQQEIDTLKKEIEHQINIINDLQKQINQLNTGHN